MIFLLPIKAPVEEDSLTARERMELKENLMLAARIPALLTVEKVFYPHLDAFQLNTVSLRLP